MYITKANFAYEQIRDAILTGKYPPNQRLMLKELSQPLHLSDMPVREALNQLEKDGLVSKIPHQGYTVSPLSIAEMEELFELRLVLECFALKLAVERIEEQAIAKLFECTQEMERCIEENENQRKNTHSLNPRRKKFMAINREFHFTIVSATGYTHLPAILSNIFDRSERYMNLLEFVVGLDRIDLLEHYNIAQKIKCRDSKNAETLMEKHFRRTVEELKQYAIKNEWVFEKRERL